MEEFDSILSLAKNVKQKLNSNSKKKNIIAIYAFNATGKTRLTNEIDRNGINEYMESLIYSAFLEDVFTWDNSNYFLKFDPYSWVIKLIEEQGLEKNLIKNFQDIISPSKIEPSFNFIENTINFKIATGDNESVDNIKISRGEESIFIWSVYYTLLEAAISELNDTKENRSTDIFDKLKYIIVDDPVSSMDDTKIITIAIKFIDAIKSLENNSVKFLIMTHHPLFFNVLINSLKSYRSYNHKSYSLFRNHGKYILKKQGDSPFAYHLVLKEDIEEAIKNKNIEKYHFNLFRSLLEKVSNFLGYDNWGDCIAGNKKQEFIRLLNLYSHNKLADLEYRELTNEEKDDFIQTFNIFLKRYFHYEN